MRFVALPLHGNYMRHSALSSPVCWTGLQTDRPVDRLVSRCIKWGEKAAALRRLMGTTCANLVCVHGSVRPAYRPIGL